MAKLIYSAICSLDGYVEDREGEFGWAEPDAEELAFVNELERPIGTYLYGRRMYETMVYWETVSTEDRSPEVREWADIWRAAEKVVYSRRLRAVTTARTRLEARFEPEEVRRLKTTLERDITVGGAALAGQALAAGLVDECHLLLHPTTVGGGKPALPAHLRIGLELLGERRFASGVVHLHYSVRSLSLDIPYN